MVYYCTGNSTAVPRLIRNKSLPIDLDGLKKLNTIIRTGVVYVFWKKAGGLLRIDVESQSWKIQDRRFEPE